MRTLSIATFLFLFGLGGPVGAQSTTLWWTGLQDRVGGGSGSPTRNFRMTETIPGPYYPSPGNGNGISSNEAAVFDLVFDTALMEGANQSMFINRDNVKLGTLTLNGAPMDGFRITDQAGQTRGTTLSGGVTAPRGLHRIEQVGADSWALTADTVWDIGTDALVLLSMPLTGDYGLSKTGAGALAISGVQFFSGGIAVDAGILSFQNRTAQPPSGTVTVAAGATLGIGLGGAGFFSAADLGQLSANTFPRVNLAPGALIGLETSVSNFTYAGSLGGSHGLSKLGLLTLVLTGAHTYSGPTEVVQGTLFLEGSTAASSTVTVHAGATLGGGGTIGGNLHFRAGGRLVFDPSKTLAVGGGVTFEGPFGVDDLFVLDGVAPLGSYRLIDGAVDLAGVQNVGVENAARLSQTRFGYFQENDGLDLVLIEDAGAPSGLDAVPGSVVYWRVSPSNRFFGSNRIYTASPSIVALPGGDYLIAFNLFGGSLSPAASDSGTTLLFRSSDRGTTWSELPSSPMMDMKRGSLFVHEGDVYIWGYQSDSGPPRIRKSTDKGSTWNAPVQLDPNPRGGTPMNPAFWVDESGVMRVWCAIGGRRMMSGRADRDLLDPANWSSVGGNAALNGEPDFPSGVVQVVSEAQIVASPQTGVVVMPKVQIDNTAPPYFSHSILLRREPNSNRELLAADPEDWVALPGADKKFGAGYDPVSGRFFVVSNPVLPAHYGHHEPWNLIRNTAALLSSEDLIHWDVEQLFLYSPNIAYEAFQYLNFDIEGDDLLVASRTAFDIGLTPRPPRGHDSNLITFHRIANFREAAPDHYLRVRDGAVERWERTQHEPAPLGVFTLGAHFAGAPLAVVDGLAHGLEGDILVRESGGRILRFDESGNFLGLGSGEGVAFAGELPSIPPPPREERSWTHPAGGDWEALAHWLYWGRPDTDREIATFGSAIGAEAAISLARERIVKGLRFRSAHRYMIGGAGSLRLRSANGTAIVEALEGHHRVDLPVVLESETRFESVEGAGIAFHGGLRLNGRTAHVGGGGEIQVGGLFDMEKGTLEMRGHARIDFLEGTTVRLSGTLAWVPEEGYVFAGDETFRIFAAGALAGAEGAFDEILLPDPGEGFSWDTSALLESGELRLIGPATAVTILSFTIGAEGVTLEIDGPAGREYSMETSTDLVQWSTIETLVPASTPFVWSKAEYLPGPRRFYRVRAGSAPAG